MPSITLDLIVEGGKASAGPQMGTTLGPLKINISDVVNKINEKTKAFAGMQVPVKVIVDTETKEFEITVGTPSASQLLLKELNAKKGSKTPKTEIIGDLTFDQIVKVAKAKKDAMASYKLKSQVKEILGTCVSMGITVEGENPKNVIKDVDSGKYDNKLNDNI